MTNAATTTTAIATAIITYMSCAFIRPSGTCCFSFRSATRRRRGVTDVFCLNGLSEVSREVVQQDRKVLIREHRALVQHRQQRLLPLVSRDGVNPHAAQVVADRARVEEDVLAGPRGKRPVIPDEKINERGLIGGFDLRTFLNHRVHGCRPAGFVVRGRLDRTEIVTAEAGGILNLVALVGRRVLRACDRNGREDDSRQTDAASGGSRTEVYAHLFDTFLILLIASRMFANEFA